MRNLKNKHVNILRFKRASSPKDIETVRMIRNQNRMFMTNNTCEISVDAQNVWWDNLDKKDTWLYLVEVGAHGVIVYDCGYGMVRFEDGVALLSAALGESCRGIGLGEKTFRFLIEEALTRTNDIRLEVLGTNTVAHTLYKKLGFKEYERRDGVIFMKLERDDTFI